MKINCLHHSTNRPFFFSVASNRLQLPQRSYKLWFSPVSNHSCPCNERVLRSLILIYVISLRAKRLCWTRTSRLLLPCRLLRLRPRFQYNYNYPIAVRTMTDESRLYLGFDLSTQQLKGIAITSDLKVSHEAVFDFDADATSFGTKKGVLTNEAEGEVFAPVTMWLKGIDTVLQRLQDKGVDFGRVLGVSGAGQRLFQDSKCIPKETC